jgi:16S rRNA processing protein RimM
VPSAGKTLIPLGLVGAPHGLHGELRVRLFNPGSEALERRGLEVALRGPGPRPEASYRVTSAKRSGADYVLLALEGVADRDAAVALRGAEICIPREALPAAAEGELYLVDLVGLQAQRPDGSAVGPIRAVHEYPASQVLIVEVEGGTLEIPLAAPYFVEARLADGLVIVDALTDLDLVPQGR